MPPTAANKDSLDFLSDCYFDTKSPVAFTTLSALSREAKSVILPLLFIKLNLGYNPKTPPPFINQFIIIFPETEVLLPGLMISGKQIWWTFFFWHILTKNTKFLMTCIDVFSKFALVVPL